MTTGSAGVSPATKLVRGTVLIILVMAAGASAFGTPHIKNIKLSVTNPSDQDLAASAVTVRIADLRKIAPGLIPTAIIVTAGDATTVDEDAAVLQTQNLPSQLSKNSAELTFQLALKPRQTRIVTISFGPRDRISRLRGDFSCHRWPLPANRAGNADDAQSPVLTYVVPGEVCGVSHAAGDIGPANSVAQVVILSKSSAPQSAPPDTLHPAHHRSYADALNLMQQEIDRTAEKWQSILQSEPATTVSKGPGFFWEGDNQTGEWKPRPGFWWTGSFWTGQLWQMYGHTKDEKYRRWAELWADRLPGQESQQNHDVGFLYFYSQSLGFDLTHEDARKQSAIAAGQRLKQLFNPATHLVASWGVNGDDTIIDTMMNLQELWWLSRVTGDAGWRDLAMQHALRTADWFIRPDGSTFQSVHYNPGDNRQEFNLHGGGPRGDGTVSFPNHAAPGERVFAHTHQGYSAVTAWGRGQAWGIYGFTAACAESKDKRLCDAAQRVSDFALDNLPEDSVTWYDFNDEGVHYRNRDTSAAAIMAAGMLRLSEVSTDAQHRRRYRAGAEKIVQSLIDRYLTPVTDSDTTPPGVLRHGSGTRPHDAPIVYGQYYLLEALLWLDKHPQR